jgi:hypothetical protein
MRTFLLALAGFALGVVSTCALGPRILAWLGGELVAPPRGGRGTRVIVRGLCWTAFVIAALLAFFWWLGPDPSPWSHPDFTQ